MAAATLGACAITYRPLFNWVFRIQPSPSWAQRKPTLADAATSSHVNTRPKPVTHIGQSTKIQALNVFHPSVPASSHGSRTTKTEDGFRRIQDSTEVREMNEDLENQSRGIRSWLRYYFAHDPAPFSEPERQSPVLSSGCI